MQFRILAGLGICFLLAMPVMAGTINFDDVPSGTLINTYYEGVIFSFDPCTGNESCWSGIGTGVYATELFGNNVLSTDQSGWFPYNVDLRVGAFQADFLTSQQTVSIDARTMLPPEYLGSVINAPFMTAFFTDGTSQTVYYPQYLLTSETWQTLSITAEMGLGIDYIRLSSMYQGGVTVWGIFDNLYFSGDGGGFEKPPEVPEPSTILLLGSGVIGLCFAARRKFGKNK